MREILFRAKTQKDVHWVFGDLMRSGTAPSDGEFDIMYWDDESGWMQEHVQPDTIGQFTGCLDNQGRRIFEGDVLECVSWNEFWSVDGKPLEQLRRRLLVSHQHGSFVCLERQQAPFDDKVWDIFSNQDCVIIGNIYDDKQLWPKRPFDLPDVR